jgi:predicted CXXCH cytochrome family protein
VSPVSAAIRSMRSALSRSSIGQAAAGSTPSPDERSRRAGRGLSAAGRTLLAVACLLAVVAGACSDRGGEPRSGDRVAESAPAHGPADGTASAASGYVGSAECLGCHSDQYQAWEGSAHAWAMKPSVPGLSAARFDGKTVSWGRGATATPLAVGDELFFDVREAGAAKPERYPAAWFFGRRAIEQHVVPFPGGRYQSLPVGYDTVAGEWFDIFADEPRDPTDWGYWKNPGMNANAECLVCHTTGFRKGYDIESDSYDTHWAEPAVTCEACHGPGRAHVDAARKGKSAPDYAGRRDASLVDTCAACHALRREITPEFTAGEKFLDAFEPVLLDESDYYADGQLLAEAYEWGSFLQSRMYREGVTCTDCHDPHAARLVADGDALCLGCHDDALAGQSHTHHPSDSAGARCVACHMPESVFMMRDRRRDHSFVIPDPQLTVELGIPSACDRCHGDRGAKWAASKVKAWFGDSALRRDRRELARTFAQARGAQEAAEDGLLACLDHCADPVHRASAAKLLLAHTAKAKVVDALVKAASDSEPLVRYGATWALAETGGRSDAVSSALQEAADDELRAIRVNAGWGLRSAKLSELPVHVRGRVEGAWSDLVASLDSQAEDAESHHALGLFYDARGAEELAVDAYRAAVRLAPAGLPARHNLAMLLTSLGRTDEAIAEFKALLDHEPRFAPASYALGVLYEEKKRWPEAITRFTQCLKAEPNYPGALHELAHAYVEEGQGDLANYVLEAALNDPGSRPEALRTLVSVNLDLGREADARRWATTAVAEMPGLAGDPRVQDLLLGKKDGG